MFNHFSPATEAHWAAVELANAAGAPAEGWYGKVTSALYLRERPH